MAWDNSVIASFEFENNKNDTTGTHVLSENGVHTYSNTIFHDGSYSLFNTNSNYFTNTSIPTALANTSYSIEFWARPPADNVFTSMIYAGGGNFKFFFLPSLNQLQVNWFGVNLLNEFDFATEKETWIHLAFTFDKDNGVFKFYKNNQVKFTKNSTTNAVTSTLFFGVGDLYFPNGYLDNFIISNTLKTNFPTLPLPTFTSIRGIIKNGMPCNRFNRNNFGGVK